MAGTRLAPLFGALLVAAPAAAQTVTTPSQLAAAVRSAGPGSEIVVADGRYVLDGILATAAAGTAAAPIVVRGASARGAVLVTDGAEEAFKLEHGYWHIRDLHIHVTGGSAHGIQLVRDGHHAQIRGNAIELESGAEGGVKGAGGPNAPQPDFVLIEGNEIWFNAPTRNSNAEGVDAVAVAGWVIRGNYIHHIQKDAVDFDGIGWGVFTKGNSLDTVIEGNVVADCFVGISLGGGGTGSQYFRNGDTTYEARNGIIRNNMVLRSGDVAVYLNKATNVRIFNNSFWGSFTSCGAGCSSIDVRYGTSSADIRNNLLDKGINPRDGGRVTEGSNMMLPATMHRAWFVAPDTNDLRLVANVPPIDQGETLALVPTDIDGTARPAGAYDIGAHERAGAGPPPPDAGPLPPDAGPTPDAGTARDAGIADRGTAFDASSVADASATTVDAGTAPPADASTLRPDTGARAGSGGGTPGARRASSSCACVERPQGSWWGLLPLLALTARRRRRSR